MHHGFPDVLLAALHDDVEIAGPPAHVLLALQAMVATADVGAGLQPTGHKFVLYVLASAAAMPG